MPIEANNESRPTWKRRIIHSVSNILRKKRLALVIERGISTDDREQGKIWPGLAHTMIGYRRLDNIQECVELALRDNVPGDFIETGVWRGGACIFMKAILVAHGVTDRKVFVADSFEGLPEPDGRYPMDGGDIHHRQNYLAVSQKQVEDNFRLYDLLDENVVFVKGWFEHTLPQLKAGQFAVIRLDGDMYGSTMDALVALYPKLSNDGFCIIDDYALPGCRRAVDDFRRANSIADELVPIDCSGHYWRKNPCGS